MSKDSAIILQNIDCNCNDCIHLKRDFDRYKSFDELHKNNKGQVTSPAHRINYGRCLSFDKDVSFIPNTLQLDTQDCFEHRRSQQTFAVGK